MTMPELSRSMLRNSLVLGLFAVITVGIIVLIQQLTVERIAQAERAAQMRALTEIVPADRYDNDLLNSTVILEDGELLGLRRPQSAYIATRDEQPVAVILPALAPDGYSGAIHLLVGIYADGTLAGVRVTGHKETPGLGDKIETGKGDWIHSFQGKSLHNPDEDGWAVKRDRGDFDQFAGATITPRAVVKAVHRALQYFDAHKQWLFNAPRGDGA